MEEIHTLLQVSQQSLFCETAEIRELVSLQVSQCGKQFQIKRTLDLSSTLVSISQGYQNSKRHDDSQENILCKLEN